MVSEQELLGVLSLLVTTDAAIRSVRANRRLKDDAKERLVFDAVKENRLAFERAREVLFRARGGKSCDAPELNLDLLQAEQIQALRTARHAYDLNGKVLRLTKGYPTIYPEAQQVGYAISDVINQVQGCVYTIGRALRSKTTTEE